MSEPAGRRFFRRCNSLSPSQSFPPNQQVDPPSLTWPERMNDGRDIGQASTPPSSGASDQHPASSTSSCFINDETGNPMAQFKLEPNGLWQGTRGIQSMLLL
ncbi:hypothetical protein Droror1_Dr00024508 [Drosera rotundifolia]